MTEFSYETVLSECADGVRTITLNRPERLNAMNRQLLADAASAFRDANADAETRVILFTGAGRAFCAGDDRDAHQHPENETEARELVGAIQQVTREMVFGTRPVVGAIRGWAVGGGFEWAINCDFSVWADSARAFFPEMSLNLFVTGAVTSLLPAMVGLVKAREMLFLGERYDAAELAALGIAWRVVEDDRLLYESRALALRLAELPERAVRDMKRVLNQCSQSDIERALELETEATVSGFLDPETTRRLKDF
jgi:enoyl-CoA hydratase/carnithine racemase